MRMNRHNAAPLPRSRNTKGLTAGSQNERERERGRVKKRVKERERVRERGRDRYIIGSQCAVK